MGTRYHGGTPAIPASRRPRPFSFNYLVREPPGRLCWRLPWWENLEEEETGYCCLPSPRSNFAQLLKVMTIMIVCPLQAGGMLGWGKSRECIPQLHSSREGPQSVCTGSLLHLGNESLQPYLSKVHFQENCSGSHKLWRPSDFQTKAKVGLKWGKSKNKKTQNKQNTLQEVAFKDQ